DGYGLSDSSVQSILDQGGQLIITVDCGIKDVGRVKEYVAGGLEFVITDHHTLPEDSDGKRFVSEEALSVVHPRYPGHEYPFPDICGTTVAWKLCQAIAAESGLDDKLEEYLDLVALATACDVMPLVDENRIIVAHGLDHLRSTDKLGLQQLVTIAGHSLPDIDTYHLGYVIGPRLNAAGRLESALDSLRLLTTTSHRQAADLAGKLQSLNLQRQEMTQSLLDEAEAQIAEMPVDQRLFLVHGEGWPEGIVGLVAGKLAEKYSRPVLVASQSGDELVGSARGPESFHLADSLRKLTHLLTRHGGHAQAAGFGIKADKLGQFTDEITALAKTKLGKGKLEPKLDIDLLTDLELVSLAELENLQAFGPFGFGNPRPIWAFLGLQVLSAKAIGKQQQHLKFTLANEKGQTISALAFRAKPEWREFVPGEVVDVAGDVNINEWNGRKEIQLIVK
ncbi:hypothetical protein KC640_03830, partial [Candidatus Dojkabacteria bacterium]|nr:hypothetical protein [Candidatus Dojkabacteria bacterium]